MGNDVAQGWCRRRAANVSLRLELADRGAEIFVCYRLFAAFTAQAGGNTDGLVAYLKQQAEENPGPFMGLLGKVLPLQPAGSVDDEPIAISINFTKPSSPPPARITR